MSVIFKTKKNGFESKINILKVTGNKYFFGAKAKFFSIQSNVDSTSHLKGGDRRVRIFSAHNNWWATPEVSLPLPYQRSAKIFLNFFATRSEDNVLL